MFQRHRQTSFYIAVLLCVSRAAWASNDIKIERQITRAYCGLYSLQAAASDLGVKFDLSAILKEEYLGNNSGSSLDELRRAAESVGLHALAVEHLNIESLRKGPFPMILHVRSTFNSRIADHWITVSSVADNRAVEHDSSQIASEESLARLAARWDGQALVLSNSAVPVLLQPWRFSSMGVIILIGVTSIALRTILLLAGHKSVVLDLKRNHIFDAVSGIVTILLIALALALAFQLTSDFSFAANNEPIDELREVHFASFLDKVTYDQLLSYIRAKETIVDARYAPDFQVGHVPGAINLSPDMSDDQLHQQIQSIQRQARIVIYCQSRGCPFSMQVADHLRRLGYGNLAIYQEGWEGFATRK